MKEKYIQIYPIVKEYDIIQLDTLASNIISQQLIGIIYTKNNELWVKIILDNRSNLIGYITPYKQIMNWIITKL